MQLDSHTSSRIEGAVYGLAYGDAWGYPHEFQSYGANAKLTRTFPAPALISDDTQMSLYVIAALLADLNSGESEIHNLERERTEEHLDEIRVQVGQYLLYWLHDPDNNRAPGNTCMHALFKLDSLPVLTGLEGTDSWSKGNGANIRCPWLGLLPLSSDLIALLAATQASVTHNNPIALGAAAVTSRVVQALVTGEIVAGEIVDFLLIETRRLLTVARFSDVTPYTQIAPKEYELGLQQLEDYLLEAHPKVQDYLIDRPVDICAALGEGWVAEEALLISAVLADSYATVDPKHALAEAAYSGGDSDSIGAITGSFIGAACGIEAFPQAWKALLEDRYKIDLEQTVTRLGQLSEV